MSSSPSSDEQKRAPTRSVAKKRRRREATNAQPKEPEDIASFFSSDDEPASKTKAQRPFRKQANARIQSWGEYTLQFQDDKTGRKNIHPSALRFTLKMVGDLARDTSASVSKSLQDDGELEESRLVQVRSSHNVKQILARVRKQLVEVPMPARYVKIEDLNLSDLPNHQRKEEIHANQKLAKSLDQQRKDLQKEYNAAKAQRDASQQKLVTELHVSTTHTHPLLLNLQLLPGDETLVDTNSIIDDEHKEAKEPALLDLLKAIPSPYD